MNDYYCYNENKPKEKKSHACLVLLIPAILLIASGFVLMNTSLLSDVKKVETIIDKKVVYTNDEEVIKVKVSTKKETKPVVKFKSKNGNVTFSETVQQGEDVETKVIGSTDGEDTVIVEVETEEGKRSKKKEVEVLVCNRPKIINTADKILSLKENDTLTLKFNVSSECLEGYEVYVENAKIAELDESYNLIGKKQGTTNLILKRNKDIIKYTVIVKPLTTSVKSVKINNKSFNLLVGKTKELSVTILPKDATNREVTYESSDTSILEVNENGVVKGIGVGTATVKVTSVSNSTETDKIKIKVYTNQDVIQPRKEEIDSILFENVSYSVEENETKVLVVNIKPEEAINKSVICKVLDKKIATVTSSNNTCIVKGISNGTTTIEATVQGSTKKATTKVTVNKPLASVTSLKFDSNRYTLYEGETKDFVVEVLPTNAEDKTITCTIDDKNVAEVTTSNNACVVKGIKKGKITLTATSSNGKTTTTNIEVNPKIISVESIKFYRDSYLVYEGESKNLEVTINPSDAKDKTISCTSSANNVATVTTSNNTCVVKGISKGTVKVTAKSSNGKTTTASVEVNPKAIDVESLKFNGDKYSLYESETINMVVEVVPSTATNKKITCTSSDKKVAIVTISNNTCVVKGVKAGKTSITATSNNGKTVTAIVTVNSKAKEKVDITSIKFNQDNYQVYEGESNNIEVTIFPSNATDKKISCTSSNKSIATVSISNNTCVVKGVKSGTITLTTKSSNGKTATTTIIVNPKTIEVTSLNISTDKYSLYEGNKTNIIVEVLPKNASNKTITCTSSDKKVATVSVSNNTCVVTGKKAGTTKITAKSNNGKTTTATVTVNTKIVAVTSLKFATDKYSLIEGDTKNLAVEVSPTNASNKTISCTSSETKVATVSVSNNTCVVTGKKTGTTKITAKSNNGKTTTATVTVSTKTVAVTGVEFTKKDIKITKGKSINVEIKILPTNASNKTITCTSDKPTIVSASAQNNTCLLTGVGSGKATITVKSNNGKTATTNATSIIPVKKLAFKETSYDVYIKDKKTLSVTITPSDATDKTISCTSSDKSIATVTASGSNCTVTGVKAGTVTITAKNSDGTVKATTKVTVKSKTPETIKVTDIKFGSATYPIYIGDSKTLTPTITPSNATNKEISCTSSDSKIGTVTTNKGSCAVKGVKEGNITITATTKDGSKKATTKVTVSKKPIAVKSIKFDSSSYTIAYNESKPLVLGITPSDATNKSITCKSLNTKVATVTYKGNTCTIKGVAPGTTKVEAYSKDGNKKATTSVTISPIAVTSIKFEKTSYTIDIGSSVTPVVKFTPTNASNKTVTCTSSDPTIATATAKGASCVVKGIKAGTVTITATAQDGNKKATTKVTVNKPVAAKTLRVASFNIGYFYCGSYPKEKTYCPNEWATQGISKYVTKVIKDEGIDLMGFQEARDRYTAGCTANGGYCWFNGVRCGYETEGIIRIIKGLGVNTGNKTELNKHFVHSCPENVDATYSKYAIDSTKTKTYDLGYFRSMDKVVLNYNGVNISFYNTHLALKSKENGVYVDYNEKTWVKMAEIIKSDPNPVIITGDFNWSKIDKYNTHLKPLGYMIAAHDDSGKSMNYTAHDYMDSIFVKTYGSDGVNHITIVPNSSKVIETFKYYSDHNMIIVDLSVY